MNAIQTMAMDARDNTLDAKDLRPMRSIGSLR